MAFKLEIYFENLNRFKGNKSKVIMMRLKKLRTQLSEKGLEGILVTSPANYRYLSGFSGSFARLLITPQEQFIITDSRYWERAKREAPNFTLIQKVRANNQKIYPALTELLSQLNLKGPIGFEDREISLSDFRDLEKEIPLDWQGAGSLITDLRMIKDRQEIQLIRESVALNDRVFNSIREQIVPGVTEKAIKSLIHYRLELGGAEMPAFEAIVGSGLNAALPHHASGDRLVANNELVIVDMGGKLKGYCSDLTRTLLLGEVPDKAREIYQIVKTAQHLALEKIGPGITCGEVDEAARSYIEEKGYGPNFGHNLGHSLGLEVHEAPSLRPGSDTVLKPGMVLTVEPGIYLPGMGGVRIEDVVLITENGKEILSKAPKL